MQLSDSLPTGRCGSLVVHSYLLGSVLCHFGRRKKKFGVSLMSLVTLLSQLGTPKLHPYTLGSNQNLTTMKFYDMTLCAHDLALPPSNGQYQQAKGSSICYVHWIQDIQSINGIVVTDRYIESVVVELEITCKKELTNFCAPRLNRNGTIVRCYGNSCQGNKINRLASKL